MNRTRWTNVERTIITRSTPIARIVDLLTTGPAVMNAADSIYSLALRMAIIPCPRVICVLDSQKRLQGLVPLRAVLESVFAEADEQGASGAMLERATAAEAASAASFETAAGLMQAPVWVQPGDTVKDAVDRMVAARLDGLPIVDGDLRVVGYLDAVELLGTWLGKT